MQLIAQKPCSFGGRQFFIGEEIPSSLVVNPKMQEARGILAIANGGEALEFTETLTGQVMFDLPIHQKEGTVRLPFSEEQISLAVDIMQMNTDDAKKAIRNITDEQILFLLNACDSRKTIKDCTDSVAAELEAESSKEIFEEEGAGEE